MHLIHLKYSEVRQGEVSERDILRASIDSGKTRFINLYMQHLSKVQIDIA
jgi:D-arabinose 5-phosphate isomerase GutQ